MATAEKSRDGSWLWSGAHGAAVAGTRTPSSRHNLPVEVASFIGREREMEEIGRLLAQTRLLTLTGAGGSGKTRLALQVAGKTAAAFMDGAGLVQLAPVADSGMVV